MRLTVIILIVLGALRGLAQQGSVVNSAHNLSASGPGAIRATSEQEICIFCHTPHRASAVQPLWNRNTPVNAYRVYSSNTLQAVPGQPTGSSKLCLSCHDGTIALGSVLSRSQTISMAGGITTLPPGKSNLGTDLSDDHPISFRYDSSLTAKNPKLKDPTALPQALRLDGQANLQCSTCHDAHDNSRGKFLVMDNANSQLCSACHKTTNSTISGHQQCSACHQSHSAPSGPYLLTAKTVTETCNTCHGGQNSQAPNVSGDLVKLSIHDTKSPVNNPNPVPNESTCASCHDPHTMTKVTAAAPDLPGNMGKVPGVNAAGALIPAARYEYEVCFRCHSDKQPTGVTATVSRKIVQSNTRLEFASSAVSFHPVETVGRSSDVPSLRTGYTTSSMIRCSDCHSSDAGKTAGGSGADGTHGSNNRPLLALRYDVKDGASENAEAYALCYKCHDRNSILSDESFPKHRLHIVDKQTPCAICHDAHGISSAQGTTTANARLINFASEAVRPDATTGRLEFKQMAPRQGNCYTQCHGVNHSGTSYTGDNGVAARLIRKAPGRGGRK